jgi:hypothetical protein
MANDVISRAKPVQSEIGAGQIAPISRSLGRCCRGIENDHELERY